MSRTLVLGTAGHIDHGKTALVKALTGVDTDRLKEEKSRGITTELGFTHLRLPSGTDIGIVDVPGHEKFIRHMVAGASGIDCVLLVVAADEGVMPQTVEHVQICRLLGVKKGLIAITKSDLVDEEMQELVREDIRGLTEATFLEDAPMLPVSSVTGAGLPALLEALDAITQSLRQRETGQLFRLPIDRVFSMKGFGTVITGTVISGRIRVGDEVEILPSRIKTRVRGIQIHNAPADQSLAGQRTAINLQGLEKRDIKRGDVLIHPGTLSPTRRIDGDLTLLPTAEHPVISGSTHRFHIGTALHLAKIFLMDRETLGPSEESYAQFVFDVPIIALPLDRYVIRGSGKIQTLGGGEILSVHPKRRKRFSPTDLETLSLLQTGSDRDRVLHFINNSGKTGISFPRLQELTNLAGNPLEKGLEDAAGAHEVFKIALAPPVFIHAGHIRDLSERILNTLKAFHKDNPLEKGLEKEVLRSKLLPGADRKLWDLLLKAVQQEGKFVVDKEHVHLKEHKITLDPAFQTTVNAVMTGIEKNGAQPPTLKELSARYGLPPDRLKPILSYLLKEDKLVKLSEELYIGTGAFGNIRQKTIAFLKENGEITIQSFKELTGLSRKFAVPILERFDKERVTLRIDQKRVLRN